MSVPIAAWRSQTHSLDWKHEAVVEDEEKTNLPEAAQAISSLML
jgi:hypothetical protein